MKFDRDKLGELVRKKVQEVNDEAGYRRYLEVPEMTELVAQSIEEMLCEDENKLLAKCEEELSELRDRHAEMLETLIEDGN